MVHDLQAGVGMEEDTTKHNVGTGLGLATVYGAITRWGGTIEIAQSAPGKGTTIVLRLPPVSGAGVIDGQ